MPVEPIRKPGAVCRVQRVFFHDRKGSGGKRSREFGYGFGFALARHAVRTELREFQGVGLMGVLRQQKVAHAEGVTALDRSPHRWNERIHPLPRQRACMTETVDHVDDKHGDIVRRDPVRGPISFHIERFQTGVPVSEVRQECVAALCQRFGAFRHERAHVLPPSTSPPNRRAPG